MTWVSNGSSVPAVLAPQLGEPLRGSAQQESRGHRRRASSRRPGRAARFSAASEWPPIRIGIGRGRHRADLDAREVVVLAVELEVVRRASGRGRWRSSRPCARRASSTRCPSPESRRARASADAEPEAVLRHDRHARRLLRDQHRLADRQLDHEGGEAQARRHRAPWPGSTRTAR